MIDSNVAHAKLSSIVETGGAQAARVIQNLMSTTPVDELVPATRATYTATAPTTATAATATATATAARGVIRGFVTPMGERPLSEHAEGQLLSRLCPRLRPYVSELLDTEGEPVAPWRVAQAETIVNEHLQHSEERYLVRAVDRQIRGVLSDTYKRLDSRPMLDSLLGAIGSVGAVPVSGAITETRATVRAIIPRVYEPTPGEFVVFGLNWGNSDFGAGAYGLSAYALRLVCTNGMTGESNLRKVHLGRKLGEGDDALILSDATRHLDEKALASATVDTVRYLLGAGAIEKRIEAIRTASATETTFAAQWARVGKNLSRATREAAKALYEGPDTLNLPAGATAWRFSNALSFLAHQAKGDAKLDLQALAGEVVTGF